jgi:hypothetical protein
MKKRSLLHFSKVKRQMKKKELAGRVMASGGR